MKKTEETSTELIVVTQLPVIEDQLQAVKQSIQTRVDEAKSLVCTEDTYKQIKAVRADLNKEYAALEAKRKEIKKQILAPYEQFEAVYKECAGDLYMSADRELAAKIAEVENGLKEQKQKDLESYFYEYLASVGIDPSFVSVDDAKIKVGLSDSRTSLRKQAKAFIDRIDNDLKVIETVENRDEVLAEYANDYNLSRAMLTVKNRHEAIEAERKRREEMKAAQEAAQIARAAVEEAVNTPVTAPVAEPVIAAPVVSAVQVTAVEGVTAKEEIKLTCTFTVKATREKLMELKQFLTEGGYEYE